MRSGYGRRWKRGPAVSSLGRICGIACFCLVATASSFSGAGPAGLDMSDTDAEPAVRLESPPPAQDRPVAQTGQPQSGNPLWGILLKQLSATRDHPLFSPSRHPPPPADAPVTAVAVSPVQAPRQPASPHLSLVGTIVNGDDGFAIFLDQETKAPLRIRMGANHQGWTLRRIEARSVTLQSSEDVSVLSFPTPSSDRNAGTDVSRTWSDPPAQPVVSTVPTTPPYLSPESNALRMPARTRGSPVRRR